MIETYHRINPIFLRHHKELLEKTVSWKTDGMFSALSMIIHIAAPVAFTVGKPTNYIHYV